MIPRSFVVFDIGLRTFTTQVGGPNGGGTFPGKLIGWYDIHNLPSSLKEDAAASAAVICTFHADLPQPPELYVYSPSAGTCRALALRKRVKATKKTFELFAVVGSGMYLLGWKKDKWDIFAKIPERLVRG